MTDIAALLDSNVVIAILAPAHPHHAASHALLTMPDAPRYAVAAHSYAESYVTLTRLGGGAPLAFSSAQAWAALETVRRRTALFGLTPAQSLDAVRDFAASAGIGARLYDRLIGEVARVNGIPTIITWNTRHLGHLVGLFPSLRVLTPKAWLEAA